MLTGACAAGTVRLRMQSMPLSATMSSGAATSGTPNSEAFSRLSPRSRLPQTLMSISSKAEQVSR